MSEYRYVLPSEPGPEDIAVCTGCSLGNPDEERFVSPIHAFVMGLNQISVPSEDKVGVPIVSTALKSRRDVALETDGQTQRYRDVVLPTVCEPLRHIELTPEAWERVKQVGCPGPKPGHKQYMLFGPRKVSCGLLRLLQSNSLER